MLVPRLISPRFIVSESYSLEPGLGAPLQAMLAGAPKIASSMSTVFPKMRVKNGAFAHAAPLVEKIAAHFAIITDKNLSEKAQVLRATLEKAHVRCHIIVLAAGEQTKSLTIVERVCGALAKFGLKRDSCLIALGGGVIGDLTGFVASIYMRGISYVSIPTTLLSMCDSSIGGKTGVDLPEGKNLVGAFYHPKLIIIDLALLTRLPERDFRSGLAEVVKHAVIADKGFFTFLEKNIERIRARHRSTLEKMIARSVAIKMRFVRGDDRESLKKTEHAASRMMLNYGHTVGHALEKLSNYELPHGCAVSIGMVAENRVAVGRGLLKAGEAERIEALLKKCNLPTKIPTDYSGAAIKKAMGMDKKNVCGKLLFALPRRIGKARIVQL